MFIREEAAQFSLEGPAHGHPMQLGSMSGGSGGVEQVQLTGINNRMGMDNVYPALQRS